MARKQRTPGYCVHTDRYGKKRGYTRIDGKSIYHPGKVRSVESLRDHDRVVGEWLTRGRTLQRTGDGTDITIGELMAAYWTFMCDQAGASSNGVRISPVSRERKHHPELGRLKAIFRVARAIYSDTPVAEFKALSLENLQKEMGRTTVQAAGREDQTFCRRVINDCTAAWERMARWAVKRELAPAEFQVRMESVGPVRAGAHGYRETAKVEAVEDADVEQVLEVCTPTLAAMIRVQWYTGMRAGEVCQMRPVDIDMRGDVWWYRPPEHKMKYKGIERVVAILPDSQNVLRPLLPTKVDEFIFKPEKAYREGLASMKVFSDTPRNVGRRGHFSHRNVLRRNRYFIVAHGLTRRGFRPCYSAETYKKAISKACLKAERMAKANGRKFNWWHSHQLRHNFITKVDAKHGIEAASVLGGHSSIDMTKRYAHATQTKREQFARLLG